MNENKSEGQGEIQTETQSVEADKRCYVLEQAGNILCTECKTEFNPDNVIIGKNPFKKHEYVYGCPNCKSIEKFSIPDNYEYEEIIKQQYGGNNCKFSGGFVNGDKVDTVYLRWEKDGVDPYTILLRPDEMQAIAWVCNGVLWSNAYHELEKKDENACSGT